MQLTTFAITTMLALTSAAPVQEVAKRWPTASYGKTIITPSAISHFYPDAAGQPQHTIYQPSYGLVTRNNNWQTADVSTLVTLAIPPAAAGKTCTLKFYLEPNNAYFYSTNNKAQIQLFKSQQPAPNHDANVGNLRDTQLATFDLVYGGEAGISEDGPKGTTFPCTAGTHGFELAGVGTTEYASWSAGNSGLYIEY